MELKEIKFSKNEDNDDVPSKLTVEMSVEEAAWIAKLSGSQRGSGNVHSGIYMCLADNFFNRFWDNGAEEAVEEYSVDVPEFKY